MKRVMVPADDLLELIESHDSWVGCMHPDDHEEYLERFAALKAKAAKYVKQSEVNQ